VGEGGVDDCCRRFLHDALDHNIVAGIVMAWTAWCRGWRWSLALWWWGSISSSLPVLMGTSRHRPQMSTFDSNANCRRQPLPVCVNSRELDVNSALNESRVTMARGFWSALSSTFRVFLIALYGREHSLSATTHDMLVIQACRTRHGLHPRRAPAHTSRSDSF
jgi:hypothetical protein